MVEVLLQAVEGKSPLLPEYQSEGSSGVDICACLEEVVTIPAGEIALIPTGFCMALPDGYEAQIRPRSGLALNFGITLPNSPGTIDSDYRGEVKIILANRGSADFVVKNGDRIAQMVIVPIVKADFKFCDELPPTKRGEGGFGHTGL